MQVPDPAIFYQSDGLNVTRGAYEGLLRYKPNTLLPEIEPLLAESFDISDDGLVYTFEIREGVKFHDGTDLTAQDIVKSFERRVGVNAGPAYMLFDVASYETPDDFTLIVTLNQPDSAFIHYMAAPYGPGIVSPDAVEANAQGDDLAQGYIATNSAGTGPYYISSFEPGEYELTAFDDYWGEGPYHAPCFSPVHIRVIPDFTTQMLELENGGLDIMIHGVTKNDLPRFEDSGFAIFQHAGINFVVMHLNTHEGPFSDPAIRAAVPQAIDRDFIVEQVYGDIGKVATTMFPQGMLPPGKGTYDPESNPQALTDAVVAGGWGDATIDLAFTTDDPNNQQLAGLIAAQLTEAGLNTTSRGVTQPETFEYPTAPDLRPDALILPATPDAAHAFTWSDLFYRPGGGLSYFSPEVCAEADQLSFDGLRVVGDAAVADVYAQASEAYAECGAFVPIADVIETVVARSDMTGFEHRYDDLSTLRLASLRGTE
jgi:peptide/nickel transport system substrate-binding protein